MCYSDGALTSRLSICTAGCLIALSLPALADDAAEILQKAAEADQLNRKRSEFFVFREIISGKDRAPDGRVSDDGTRTFEVTFVEGESYFRLTEINGRPLGRDAEDAEDLRYRQVVDFRRRTPLEDRRRRRSADERQRLKFDISLVAQHHEARLDREEGEPGNRVWVLSVWPKSNTPKPKNPNEWALSLRGYLRIDQATGHLISADLEQAYPWRDQPQGSQAAFRWHHKDDVWLIKEICSTTPLERGDTIWRRETVQLYSNYRKFQAESVLSYSDLP